MGSGGNGSTKALEEQQRQRQTLIQQGLHSINRSFAGFNPEFYERQRAATTAAMLPQVGDQYQQARSQLGYSLANQGLLRSSAGTRLAGTLDRELATQKTNVANAATQAVQGLQQQVSQQKGSLIGALEQSADPTTAAQRAAETATQFSSPSLVQPLGSLFQNWSNIYLARQYANVYGQQPSFGSGARPGTPSSLGSQASSYSVQ
jgi:hypothetical protein